MLHWLSEHFETFFLINSVWLISLLIARLALKATEIPWKAALDRILYGLVLIGIGCMVVAAGYIGWIKYFPKYGPARNIAAVVTPQTFWVKSDRPVYFIAGPDLAVVNLNGTKFQYLFEGEEPIREYHISPGDGKILVVTTRELHLIDRQKDKSRKIAALDIPEGDPELRGAFSRVLWAPDGLRFFYEVSKWSPYSSQDRCYIYDVREDERSEWDSPLCGKEEIFWGKWGQHLYYGQRQILGEGENQFRIFRIPLKTLEVRQAATVVSPESSLIHVDLSKEGIKLDGTARRLSFAKSAARNFSDVSRRGEKIAVDRRGVLYYVDPRGKRKNIFLIPGHGRAGTSRLRELRWTPDGRYVLLSHEDLGILVIDPFSREAGHLIDGDSFGWHQ